VAANIVNIAFDNDAVSGVNAGNTTYASLSGTLAINYTDGTVAGTLTGTDDFWTDTFSHFALSYDANSNLYHLTSTGVLGGTLSLQYAGQQPTQLSSVALNLVTESFATMQNDVVTSGPDLTPPVIAISGQALSSDTGQSSTDRISRQGAVSFYGTVSDLGGVAGVEIYDGVTDLGAATLTAVGGGIDWSFYATLPADGNHVLRAVTTDNAGNTASINATSIIVDTAPPTVAVTSETISNGQVTLTGTASDAHGIATVQVFNGTTLLGNANVSGNAWTFTRMLTQPGPYGFYAVATDLAGNSAASSFGPPAALLTAPTALTTSATTVTYTLSFTAPVYGTIDARDFTLRTSDTIHGAAIVGVDQPSAGGAYTVTVATGIGSGTIEVDFNAAATGVVDISGHAVGTATGPIYLVRGAQPAPVHANDLTYSGTASGYNHLIDIPNFEASYADLVHAFGTNQQNMQTWYNANEPTERRVETFDGLDYVASYNDLIGAFGSAGSMRAVEDAGANHFIANGMAEGRSTTFNGLDYIASYSDLIAAFGVNGDAGAYHYIENGAREGRTTTFDGLDYIASYGDLIRTFGANEQAGAAHFIANGAHEGRTTRFDGLSYIAQYADLMNGFGADNEAGVTHYITNGFAEGRTTSFDVAGYQQAHPDLLGRYSSDDAFLTAYIDTYRMTGHVLT
jgi:hypothetical protein